MAPLLRRHWGIFDLDQVEGLGRGFQVLGDGPGPVLDEAVDATGDGGVVVTPQLFQLQDFPEEFNPLGWTLGFSGHTC